MKKSYLPNARAFLSKENKLRIAVLTGAGTRIVSPLLQDDFHVVGIAELIDTYSSQPRNTRFIKNCYHLFFNFKRPDYLFLEAKKRGIPYLDLKNKIDERLGAWLGALSADILVTYVAPLLPSEIFMIPTYGTINLHPSLLPKYRGAHPIMWMHLNMDQEGGVTIHCVDTGIDTGAILAQAAFHIPLGTPECVVEHVAIDELGVPLLKKVLRQMEAGIINTQIQPTVKFPDNCKRLTPQEYRAKLDWDKWDIKHLWHVLRCTDHWKAIYLSDKLRCRSGVWSIGTIEYTRNSLSHNILMKDCEGYYLNHRDGKIRLTYKTSFKKYIKTWLERTKNYRLYNRIYSIKVLEWSVLVFLLISSLLALLTDGVILEFCC